MKALTPRASQSAALERSLRPWLHVVGIGDDGLDGCLPEAWSLIARADILAGAPRQLALVAKSDARRIEIAGDWRAAIEALATHRGQRVVLLASGDPLLHGVGVMVAEVYSPDEVRVVPHVSSFALVCARMLWSQPDVHLVRLSSAATDPLERELRPGRRIVVLSADDASPGHVAAVLKSRGYGASRIDVFEHLGGARERCAGYTAASFRAPQGDRAIARLNTLAITCVADAATDRGLAPLSSAPGLPEGAFEHDGQITKQEVRAVTIARLAPRPGELLWDIGLGSGAIAIEWLRAAPGAHAVGVERNSARAACARRNAAALGMPDLDVIEGDAATALDALPVPDAIFIGGGLTTPGLVAQCWQALKPGGRLVANTVTLESEGVLLAAHREYGGAMTRISIERSDTVGRMTGWRPAMTVTQWAVRKLHSEDATDKDSEATP